MKKVKITIELSEPLRKIVVESLLPEAGRTVPRTLVKILETNTGVKLEIEAETTNALRAALNSYLRWLNCIVKIANNIGNRTEDIEMNE